jgi:hypothetical protein
MRHVLEFLGLVYFMVTPPILQIAFAYLFGLKKPE